jgi:ABC-type dipeptide/oligopeptide/nickel transport system permease component
MRYLARRAVWTVLAVLGVSVLIFFLVRLLPGNIVDILFAAAGIEQDVVRGNWLPGAAGNKLTAALGDDVKLVARMGRLEIRAARLGQLDHEGTMFEESNVMFAVGSGQTTKCFREINLEAFAADHGDDRNNTLQCEPQTNDGG